MKKLLLLSVSLLSVSSAASLATATTPVTKPCFGSEVTKDVCESKKAGVEGLLAAATKAADEKFISEITKKSSPASGVADTRLADARDAALAAQTQAAEDAKKTLVSTETSIVGVLGATTVAPAKFTFTKTAAVTIGSTTTSAVIIPDVTFDTAGFATLSGFATSATDEADLKAKLKAHLQKTYADVVDSEVDALATAVKPILDAKIASVNAVKKADALAKLAVNPRDADALKVFGLTDPAKTEVEAEAARAAELAAINLELKAFGDVPAAAPEDAKPAAAADAKKAKQEEEIAVALAKRQTTLTDALKARVDATADYADATKVAAALHTVLAAKQAKIDEAYAEAVKNHNEEIEAYNKLDAAAKKTTTAPKLADKPKAETLTADDVKAFAEASDLSDEQIAELKLEGQKISDVEKLTKKYVAEAQKDLDTATTKLVAAERPFVEEKASVVFNQNSTAAHVSATAATQVVATLGRIVGMAPVASTKASAGTATSAGVADQEIRGVEVYGEIMGARETQKQISNYAGYKANTVGVLLGAQTRISDTVVAGAGLSYADTKIKERLNADNKTDAKSYMLHMNAGYTSGNIFTDGLLVLGRTNINLSRLANEASSGGDVKYAAKTHGETLLGRVRTGYIHKITEEATVAPYLAVQAGVTRLKGYSEHGGLQPFAFGNQKIKTVQVGAGVMASTNMAAGDGMMITPRLDVNYMRETQPVGRTISATLAGSPVNGTVNTPEFGKDILSVGLGADVKADKTTVSFDYNVTSKKGNMGHRGTVRVKYAL